MLAVTPQGVGIGNFGNFYMNWLQATNASDAYRTMVSNPLTALTEWGLPISGLLLFISLSGLFLLIPDSNLSQVKNSVAAAHAVLASFLVAGIFSTTMETPMIWIPVSLASLILASLTFYFGSRNIQKLRHILIFSACITLLGLGGLFIYGKILRSKNSLDLSKDANGTHIRVENTNSQNNILLVDQEVLGENYGKFARDLVTHKSINLFIPDSRLEDLPTVKEKHRSASPDTLIVTGRKINNIQNIDAARYILIAPDIPKDSSILQKIFSEGRVLLILPGFDEDGRSAWWNEEYSKAQPDKKSTAVPIEGFGNNLEQAKTQILDLINNFSQSSHR